MKKYYKERTAEPRDRRKLPKQRVNIIGSWKKCLAKLPSAELVARYGDICKRQSPHSIHAQAIAGLIEARMVME